MKFECKRHTYDVRDVKWRILYVISTSHVRGLIGPITPYYLKSNFGLDVFWKSSPIFWEHLFLKHLRTTVSISLTEKDFIVTTWDSFKVCILRAWKIGNQIQTKFQAEKVPQ